MFCLHDFFLLSYAVKGKNVFNAEFETLVEAVKKL